MILSALDHGHPRHFGEHRTYPVDDGLARHRQPAVTQNGMQFGFFDGGFESQQRSQLSVAILLDDKNRGMRIEKTLHLDPERKSLYPHVIDMNLLTREHIDRFAHGTVAAADTNDAV